MFQAFEAFEAELQKKEVESQDTLLQEFNRALNNEQYDKQKYENVVQKYLNFDQEMKKSIENGGMEEIMRYSIKKFNIGRKKEQLEQDIKRICKPRKTKGNLERIRKEVKERSKKKEEAKNQKRIAMKTAQEKVDESSDGEN
jgi:hypothetical protein